MSHDYQQHFCQSHAVIFSVQSTRSTKRLHKYLLAISITVVRVIEQLIDRKPRKCETDLQAYVVGVLAMSNTVKSLRVTASARVFSPSQKRIASGCRARRIANGRRRSATVTQVEWVVFCNLRTPNKG